MRFLVHGSIAYDLLLSSDGSFVDALDPKALDRLSVSYVMPHFKRHHGGTGANIAWNLALLGHAPLLVGAVGPDGGPYLTLLQEKGVDTRYVERLRDCSTATAIIATDDEEHQITFFHPGADAKGVLPELSDERDDLAYAIVSPRDSVLMLQAVAQCRELRIPYLFDPGQQSHAFTRDEFRRALTGSSGLVVNEYEWELAASRLAWEKKDVLAACGLLVVTLGDKGMVLMTPQEEVTVRACKPDRIVNPTGAGDSARAGLLLGLASGWSLRDTGRLAAILGSFVVEREGTLLETLDRATIQERAMENYGEELPFTNG
jgi:adenosine kinase